MVLEYSEILKRFDERVVSLWKEFEVEIHASILDHGRGLYSVVYVHILK